MPPSMGELMLQALDHRRKGKAAKDRMPHESTQCHAHERVLPGCRVRAIAERPRVVESFSFFLSLSLSLSLSPSLFPMSCERTS